jgi:hypothetical protein
MICLVEHSELFRYQRGKESILAVEMSIEGTVGYSCILADIPDGCIPEADFAESLHRTFQDQIVCFLVIVRHPRPLLIKITP